MAKPVTVSKVAEAYKQELKSTQIALPKWHWEAIPGFL